LELGPTRIQDIPLSPLDRELCGSSWRGHVPCGGAASDDFGVGWHSFFPMGITDRQRGVSPKEKVRFLQCGCGAGTSPDMQQRVLVR
jgi:hypothetical protein